MKPSRLEAFSDGVIAIIITIMVLEIKVPHGTTFEALVPLWPVFVSYVLSFAMVLIYWNNHHHMFQSVHKVNGAILLANGHLLFWLSLSPFASGWMGENHFAPAPVFLYGFVLMMSGIAYYILSKQLIKLHGTDSTLAIAVGKDKKGILSLIFYALALVIAPFYPFVSCGIYAFVALGWFIPDRRIESVLGN